MFGNWTFTATRSGCPVGETCAASVAWWTCPIEAAAKGIGLKFAKEERHVGPREDVITLCMQEPRDQSVHRLAGKERGADLHLPVGHVVRAVLHAAKDAV